MPAVDIQVDATIQLSVGNDNVADVDHYHEKDLLPIVQLYPPGRAWEVLGGEVWAALNRGIARCFGRVDVIERKFIRQFDPLTVTYALEDWERLLRLSADGKSDKERRAAISAKIQARGGQSIPYWTAFLETLGYTNVVVTPLENRFRVGDRIRKRLQNNGWAFALLITADSIPGLDAEMQALVLAAKRATIYIHFNLV